MRPYPCFLCPEQVDLEGAHVKTDDWRFAHVECGKAEAAKRALQADLITASGEASRLPSPRGGTASSPRGTSSPEDELAKRRSRAA